MTGDQISPPEVLASRLMWMRDRQGRDPREMLVRQVEFGVMTRAQANEVADLLDLAPL